MSLLEIFFLSFLASACTGAVLTYRAWRGLRVGDHLHCRKCEFDLFGLPADASTCPECGTLIRYGRPRGRVEHRPLMMRWGLSLGTVGALGLIIVIGSLWRDIGWRQRMPMWYLLSSLRGAPTSVSSREFLQEIDRRLGSGRRPTTAEVQKVADVLLDLHQSTRLGNRDELAQMIENLHGAAMLSAKHWDRYLANAIFIGASVRPVVGEADPIGALVVVSGNSLALFNGNGTMSVIASEVDGEPAGASATVTEPIHRKTHLAIPTLSRTKPLADGSHTLTLHYVLTVVESTSNTPVIIKGSVTRPFMVQAGFDPLVARMDVAKSATVPILYNARVSGIGLDVFVDARTGDATAPANCYDLLLEKDHAFQTVAGFLSVPESHQRININVPLPATDHMEFILRPSRDRALSDPRITDYDAMERRDTAKVR